MLVILGLSRPTLEHVATLVGVMGEERPVGRERPSKPDPRVLSEALDATEVVLGRGPDTAARWMVGPAIERPRSTLFVLRLVSPRGRRLEAFYKTIHPPRLRDRALADAWVESLRAGLRRSPEMLERLNERGAPEGIRAARVLAVDPESMTIITEGIAGQQVGNSMHRAVTPWGRLSALRVTKRVGRAIRLIEQLSSESTIEEPPWLSPMRFEQHVEEARERGILSEREAPRLRALMRELFDATLAGDDGTAYVHGDLTPTNVLRVRDGIGLIDFSWHPQPRAYDLAKFAVLLESVPFSPPGRRERLVGSLLEGYGDAGVTRSPGWRLVRLQQQLRIVMRLTRSRSRGGLSRGIARRALHGIREELGDRAR